MKHSKLFIWIFALSLLTTIISAQEYTVDSNTTNLWHFNEGSGNNTTDELGVNNGTITGATWVDGLYDNALNFTGNDYVNIDKPFMGIQDTFTIEANFKTNILHGGDNLGGHIYRHRATNNDLIILVQSSPPRISYQMLGPTVGLLYDIDYADNEWHHVALTYDGITAKAYFDGILVNSTTSVNMSVDWNESFFREDIGDNPHDAGTRGFNGTIDEVRISNIARTTFNVPPRLQLNEVIPLQVVENVDFVKGKRTLVYVNFSANPHANITGAVYINNTLVELEGMGNATADANGNGELNMFFTNDTFIGGNISLNISINNPAPAFPNINITKTNNRTINIKETKKIKLLFIPINIDETINENDPQIEFIQDTYPLEENGADITNAQKIETLPEKLPFTTYDEQQDILLNLQLEMLGRAYSDNSLNQQNILNIIGVVPDEYFKFYLKKDGTIDEITGINYKGVFSSKIILYEESQIKTTAHEIGHTLSLCDEYNSQVWAKEDSPSNQCPNGDEDDDDNLDEVCLNSTGPDNHGCPTMTLPQLYNKYNPNITGNTTLRNFMGGSDSTLIPGSNFESWIDTTTYTHLVDELDIDGSNLPAVTCIETSGKMAIISAKIGIGEFFEIGNSFSFQGNCVMNTSLFSGSHILELFKNENLTSSFPFDPNYNITPEGGTDLETNKTLLFFAVPIEEGIDKIRLRNATTTINEMNRTLNNPTVIFNTPLKDVSFGGIENITWNASDNDGDNMTYILMLNKPNGENSSLKFDYDQTNFSFNFSTIQKGRNYRLTLFASDGFNTNSTISKNFCIDGDLSICGLKTLHQTDKEVTFEFIIKNNLNENLNNINWTLQTGEENITSNKLFNLSTAEDLFVIITYNYSINGNFTVTAKSAATNITESQSINITI